MTASDRLSRAVAATDLAAGDTHAARLARQLARRPRPATAVSDLDSAPRWLRDPEAGRRLACRAALAHAAPALARSIDGRRLGGLAAAVGTATLDWAMALGEDGGDGGSELPAPDALEAQGFALLATTLPPALAARLPMAPAPATPAAARAVAAALACPIEAAT